MRGNTLWQLLIYLLRFTLSDYYHYLQIVSHFDPLAHYSSIFATGNKIRDYSDAMLEAIVADPAIEDGPGAAKAVSLHIQIYF